VHVNTARRVAKSGKVYANKYIISLFELTIEELKTIKENVLVKNTTARAVHVYNKEKTKLLKTFPTVNSFMQFSNQSGSDIKLLCSSDRLWLNEYFLSYDLIPEADNGLAEVEDFNPDLNTRVPNIPVYTYSADGKKLLNVTLVLENVLKNWKVAEILILKI